MTETISDPLSRLLSLVPPEGSPRVVIGLVGLPGAGKSTQARIWADRVNAQSATPVMQSVGMDGFHLSLLELAQLPPPQNDLARRGAPWTFDAPRLAHSLAALRQHNAQGQQADLRWPDFNHSVGDPVPNAIPIDGSIRLVLVEGLYLLLPDAAWNLKNLFDEVWFLDEDLDAAMGRLVKRHCQSWGITEAQALARIAVNDQRNAAIANQTRAHADALVAPLPLDARQLS